MIVVALLELVVMALLLYLGVIQVVLPLWRGTSLFPMFRRERHLQQELTEVTENVVEAELEKKIAKTAHKVESIRQTVRRPTRSKTGSDGTINP